MRSWKSLGATQRRLLLAARHRALDLARPADQAAALKLHSYGLLDRGRRAKDWTINPRGLELSHGKEI